MELTEANVLSAIEQHKLLMDRAQEIAIIMFKIRTANLKGGSWCPWFEIDIDDEGEPPNTMIYARWQYGHDDSDSMTIPLAYLWTDNGDINLLEQQAIEERNRLAEEKKLQEAAEREYKKELADRATYERLRERFNENA